VTSAFSSYSGCRQYLEDIVRARAAVSDDGKGDAPVVDKIRGFFNHPGFIETVADRVREAFAELPLAPRAAARLLYSAHSVPVSMARGSQYVPQLEEACRLVEQAVGLTGGRLVWQSRSGPPAQPWLEPDILAVLRDLRSRGVSDVVVMPIGFISDHMEVLYDLDTEAAAVCDEIGLRMVRAGTPGVHPRFIRMIRELIEERISGRPERATVGALPPGPDTCPPDCCPAPQRPVPPS
jgi:ferrochelatase